MQLVIEKNDFTPLFLRIAFFFSSYMLFMNLIHSLEELKPHQVTTKSSKKVVSSLGERCAAIILK